MDPNVFRQVLCVVVNRITALEGMRAAIGGREKQKKPPRAGGSSRSRLTVQLIRIVWNVVRRWIAELVPLISFGKTRSAQLIAEVKIATTCSQDITSHFWRLERRPLFPHGAPCVRLTREFRCNHQRVCHNQGQFLFCFRASGKYAWSGSSCPARQTAS